jgi:ABC-type branched-subunit amino acid transport system substrate-binding protein
MVGLGIGIAISFSTPGMIVQIKTIKFGALVQLSSSLANTGRNYRDAYNIAVIAISDRGGVSREA